MKQTTKLSMHLVAVCFALVATTSIPSLGRVGGWSIAGELATSYFRQDHGVSTEQAELPDVFDSKEGYVWRRALASGHSCPCVFGDRVYLTTFDQDEQTLATVALNRKTGSIRWKRTAPTKSIEKFHQTGSPATCTPACDGERLYVFFGSYGVLCYDLDGQQLWSKPMGPFQDEFGANSSPILVDDVLILNEDHDKDSFLTAIDKLTGETRWTTPRPGFTRSYSTPVVWDSGGTKQLVVAGALQLAGYDLKSGEKRWWIDGLSRIVSPTPVVAGEMLFAAGWTPGGDASKRIAMEPFPEATKKYDKNDDGKISREELPEGPVLTRFFRIDLDQDSGLNEKEWKAHARVFERAQNQLLAVKSVGDAKGDLTSTHVAWSHRRGLPSVPSPLVYEKVVYIVKNGGIVTSLGAADGGVLKQGRATSLGNYYASPVAGDGKVYLASEPGVITVLKAGGDWDILSYHDFGERIMATPTIVDGEVYVRTDDALYRFEKK